MTLTKNDLSHFTSTEQHFRHGLVRNVFYSEGVKFLADKAGAYWLLDKIATSQMELTIRTEPFQSWRLTVADSRGRLTCDDGNGVVLHTEEIDFTDFPLDEVSIWVEDRVMLLPSEH